MNYIELFVAEADNNGLKTAVVDRGGSRSASYEELNKLSYNVAGKIHAMGCGEGDFVAICMESCMEYIAAYLGTLKAGCAVVPLITAYPKERVDYIVRDCAAKLVITEDFFADIGNYSEYFAPAGDESPALVIYTSGSTGNPKGVCHSTRGLYASAVRHLKDFIKDYRNCRFASFAPFSFVVSFSEIYAMLLGNNTVYIVPDSVKKSPTLLTGYINENSIDAIFIPPQFLSLMDGKRFNAKHIFTGSEAVSNIFFPGKDLINSYGQSETLSCAAYFAVDRHYALTPIGKVLKGLIAHVLDENGSEVANGELGELCIEGDFGVCYLNDPKKSAETFIKLKNGNTMIHTGDNVLKNENDDLVFVSREDWMVKISGQRVELMEVERKLNAVDGVSISAVRAWKDCNKQTYITGYYQKNKEITETEIRNELEKTLPEYMIPRFLICMESLPKNINGKLDRKSLPEPNMDSNKAKYRAPKTEIERLLCDGFAEALNCGIVGVDDNFIALGGDSIRVLRLLEIVNIPNLSASMILTGKMPAAIAALLKENDGDRIQHNETISVSYPMTEAQLGVYMECLESPDSMKYNIPACIRLPDKTDINRYINAVCEVTESHPIFRVTADIIDGVPSMRVNNHDILVDTVEARSVEEELNRFIRPFDLKNGPLYRFEICRYDQGYAFIFDVHHLIFDGSSLEVFVNQIERVYEGGKIKSEQLTVFDISDYERNMKSLPSYQKAQEFFRSKLQGASVQSLANIDKGSGDKSTGSGYVVENSCGLFDADDVSRFIKTNCITENTLFLGAFAYTLKVFAGVDSICFTTVNSGRHDSRMSESIGMFVKTLPMCFTISDKQSVPDFLTNVQNEFYETMENDCISFRELSSAYGINTDVSFVYQSQMLNAVETIDVGETISALEAMMFREGANYRIAFRYDNNCYTKAYIESLTETYMRIVSGMISCEKLSDIQLVSGKSEKLIDEVNKTDFQLMFEPVHTLFEKQAAQQPQKIAVVAAGEHISYAELDALANRVAYALSKLGLKREAIVGIVLPRGKEAIVAELAVWKASGAFLPMTPSYPDYRIVYCLEDSGAQFVITNEKIRNERRDVFSGNHSYETLISDELLENESEFAGMDVNPEQLAYCIYTSGSTGKPKGVMIEHRNVCNFVNANEKNELAWNMVTNKSVVLGIASLSFDASIFEIWMPLCNGSRVCIATDEEIHDPFALAALIKSEGVNMMLGIPSFVMGIIGIEEVTDALRNISCFVIGGEAFPKTLYRKILSIRNDAVIINEYGPTETTVGCISKTITNEENITIGKPSSNVQAYIMDKESRMLPAGACGELIIVGDGVGRGYLNLPEKTAEKFFRLDGKRAYHSGDIAQLTSDGEIKLFGRIDNQIKLRGLRVELDEIEKTMLSLSGMMNVKVVVRHSETEDYLVGFFTAGQKLALDSVQRQLKEKLPAYMVPSVLVQLEKMPFNINGKIDKNALPEVTYTAEEVTKPENDTQQRIFETVAEILGHHNFGVDTDLYEAGLASVGAIRLTAMLDKQFGIPFSISVIKNCSTVRKLEAYILEHHTFDTFALQADYPLTRTQEGIAVECMMNPGTTIYNVSCVIRMGCGVDAERLVDALKMVVNAHPYLKTRLFTDGNGRIRAKRRDDAAPNVMVEKGDAPAVNELVYPFSLFEDELYRLKVYCGESGCALFADFHHIIFDGTSENIFFDDLNRAYAGEQLIKEDYTGFEAALDEEMSRTSDVGKKAEEYYRSVFNDCDTDNLPLPDPEIGEPGAGNVDIDLPISCQEVAEICSRYGVSENALFNSAFGYALCKLNGKEETVYTTVYNGRNDSRKAKSVSMFVKTLPVKCISGEKGSISEYIRNTEKQLIDSMVNDTFSFADISALFSISADVMFIYQGAGFAADTICGEKYEVEFFQSDTSKSVIMIQVFTKGNGYSITAEYRRDLYGENLMRCMLEFIAQILKEFLLRDDLHDVRLLSEKQKDLLDSFNSTESHYAVDKTVIDLIRERKAEMPDNIAVCCKDRTYTYRELDRISDNIAVYLLQKGIGHNDVVSVLIDRSEYMPIAALGIMKAGAAYQPLDISYPEERLNFMMEDSGAKLLIADSAFVGKLSDWKGYTLLTDDINRLSDVQCDEREKLTAAAPVPEDVYVLLYTSGSTGMPKGTMLIHRNLMSFCNWYCRYMEMNENSCATAYASYGFDCCMLDMYPILTVGGRMVIVPTDLRLDLYRLNDMFREQKVTHAFMTTQVGRQFVQLCDSPYLQHFSVAGEALVPVTPPKKFKFYNAYGPTECTIYTTIQPVTELYRRTPIGKPLDNLKLYVVDKDMNRLPSGIPGELCVAGHQVSKGYLNCPEKTARVFIDNPFDDSKGYERLYRTGDIVRLLPDGMVDYIGRNDGQVKVRGFRIELTEVEEVIRRFEGISDATVAPFEAPAGGNELAAYIVSAKPVDISALKDFIRREKPAYMVPAVIMQIDSIPLNQNQKVNRHALPKPELGATEDEKEKSRSGDLTECEKRLLAILKDTTGIVTTDVVSVLVELGITSITAISFVTVVEKNFGVDIPVARLLQGMSVMDVENEIMLSLLNGRTDLRPDLEKKTAEIRDEYPLTQTQLGVYYETMQRPGSLLYNMPFCLRIEGIDGERLCEAIKTAVKARSFLNTHVKTGRNGFLQVRKDTAETVVSITDLGVKDIREVFSGFVKPFDLHTGPLYRFEVVNGLGCIYLLMDFHHIAFDGYSVNLFMKSLKQAYETGSADAEEYSYFDYSLDEEMCRQGEKYAKAEAYFNDLLSDFENTTEIPSDIGKKVEDGKTAIETEFMDKNAVEVFCRNNRIMPSALFLASVFYTISRFAFAKDVYISTISNGRSNSKIRDTVGMFVHTLPVAIRPEDDMSVMNYISAAADSMKGSIANEIYPFTEIVRHYGYGTDIMYECQLGVASKIALDGHMVENIAFEGETPKFKLKIAVLDENDGICLRVEYNDALYSKNYMQLLTRSLKTCTERMMADTAAAARRLSLLSAEDEALLEQYSHSEIGEIPYGLVHLMFEARVAEYYDKTAVIACDGELTYGELDRQANVIANVLISNGVGRGDMIVLLLPRRSYYFAAAFGVMKAGAAFIPCDPRYPADRISLITEDSGAEYIVTTNDKLGQYDNARTVDIAELIKGDNDSRPRIEMSSEDLAYAIYTSGSTGTPKGVLIRHIGVCSYFTDTPSNILYRQVMEKNIERILCITTVSFDLSMKDSFGMLCNGKTLVFADEEQMNDPVALTGLMEKYNVQLINGTPSRLQQYMEYSPFMEQLEKLKMIVCGGELYPDALKKRLQDMTEAVLINTYGPTEITISSNMADLTRAERVTVGKPLYNYREFIVDADENLLPPGIIGELYTGGPGVAKGYNNLEEINRERFVDYHGFRVYKTGDYARWDSDGNVVILGRTDNQVKLRGLRIELGEIENQISQYPFVKQTLVLVRKLNGQDTLCAYFTASEKLEPTKLRDSLRAKLTHYMVPTAYLQVDAFPVNANGKIDRNALPDPMPVRTEEYVEASGKTERFFCDAFAKTLKLDKVGAKDDFFELGGTSLTVTSVVVAAVEAGYQIGYSDLFSHTTPRSLAEFIMGKKNGGGDRGIEDYDYNAIQALLSRNTLESFRSGEKRELGNILLTGATGYMGIHVLRHFLRHETGKIYCLLRRNKHEAPILRLKNRMFYYFEGDVIDELEKRVTVLDGDVTRYDSFAQFEQYEINTVFNCAANVKHFSAGTDIEDINIGGVENCIRFCRKKNARLIHFSTTSIAGEFIAQDTNIIPVLDEHILYLGQILDNKYTHSKFIAERMVLSAIIEGLDAKVIRVGTLSPRRSDGEFQINYLSNSFMGRLRTYALIGAFPYSLCQNVIRMGAIDVSVDAYIRLAKTPGACCLFNACNNHTVFLSDIIACMRKRGRNIRFVEEEKFNEEMLIAAENPEKAAVMSSLLAYIHVEQDGHRIPVNVDCHYTNEILSRTGFLWNITDNEYIETFLEALETLGYFDLENHSHRRKELRRD